MDALRKKWHSRQGASILMALLFLVVCMMVGASVLMAAVSNAGKLKSNQDEQQKYLTLSSALNLVCDELESVEYVGKYRYGWVQVQKEIITYDEDNKPISNWVDDYVRHYYWQEQGEVRKRDGAPWELNETLPLYNDLDIVFSNKIKGLPKERENRYTPIDESKISATLRSPHTIVLKPGDGVDEAVYGGLTDEVTINAKISTMGTITLTATFAENDSYMMQAVLKSNGKPGNILALSSSPTGQNRLGTERGEEKTYDKENGTLKQTDSVTWTLDYIAKKEAKKDEQAAG